jgi:hypothetical protein
MTDQRRPDEGFQASARIGERGASRRPLVTTAVVVALLVVAVVKPWNLPSRPIPAEPSRSPAPGAVAAASGAAGPPSPAGPAPSSVPGFPFAPRSDDALTAVAEDRAGWGMRAIVQSRRGILAGSLLAERWSSVDVPASGEPIPGAFDGIPLADQLSDVADVAYALGVTAPPDAMPLDIRFWRTSEDRGWVRLLPEAIPGPEPGSWLWRPDPLWATVDGTWPSGTYRVDVLLGPRIVRLEAVLGGTFRADTRAVVPAGLGAPIDQALDGLPPGPFVLTEYGPAWIPLAASGQFDELSAWLAPYLGTGFVAPAYGQTVNGLGVLGEAGAPPEDLVIERISGVPQPSAVALNVSVVQTGDGSGSAMFGRPLGGHLFADGLYRITATWPGGRSEDWEVEVTPGTAPSVPTSPLEALSRWESGRSPGSTGFPVVTVGPRDGDLAVSDGCPTSTRITATDALLGVVLPPEARLTGVRVLVLGSDRNPDWRFRFEPDAVPGLTVVAVPNGGLPARDYDLVLDLDGPHGPWRVLQRICVVG